MIAIICRSKRYFQGAENTLWLGLKMQVYEQEEALPFSLTTSTLYDHLS